MQRCDTQEVRTPENRPQKARPTRFRRSALIARCSRCERTKGSGRGPPLGKVRSSHAIIRRPAPRQSFCARRRTRPPRRPGGRPVLAANAQSRPIAEAVTRSTVSNTALPPGACKHIRSFPQRGRSADSGAAIDRFAGNVSHFGLRTANGADRA